MTSHPCKWQNVLCQLQLNMYSVLRLNTMHTWQCPVRLIISTVAYHSNATHYRRTSPCTVAQAYL
jgi:hypothetical protein